MDIDVIIKKAFARALFLERTCCWAKALVRRDIQKSKDQIASRWFAGVFSEIRISNQINQMCLKLSYTMI